MLLLVPGVVCVRRKGLKVAALHAPHHFAQPVICQQRAGACHMQVLTAHTKVIIKKASVRKAGIQRAVFRKAGRLMRMAQGEG